MTVIGSADITVDLLDASYQLKKNQLRIDLNELQETRFIKIDLDALNFEYKRLKLKNSIEELSTLKLTSNLSSQLAERNITQAQYEKESYDIAYNAAQKRIGIAKEEADSVVRQLYKTASFVPPKRDDFVEREFALLRKIEQANKEIVPLQTNVQSRTEDLAKYGTPEKRRAIYSKPGFDPDVDDPKNKIFNPDTTNTNSTYGLKYDLLLPSPATAFVPIPINIRGDTTTFAPHKVAGLKGGDGTSGKTEKEYFDVDYAEPNARDATEIGRLIGIKQKAQKELELLRTNRRDNAKLALGAGIDPDDGYQAKLTDRLLNAQKRAASEEIALSKLTAARRLAIEKEAAADFNAVNTIAADSRRRGLIEEIAAHDQRSAANALATTQIDNQRKAIDQQSASQRTAIDLLQQYQSIVLERGKELEALRTKQKTDFGDERLKALRDQLKEVQTGSKDPVKEYDISKQIRGVFLARQEIQRQVQEISGRDNFAQLRLPGLDVDGSLIVRRQQQEDALAQSQAAALEAQLQQKRLGIQLDLQSQAIASSRIEQETQLAQIRAEQQQVAAVQQLLSAQYTLETLPENASQRQRGLAQNQVANAQQQVALANKGVDTAGQAVESAQASKVFLQELGQRLLRSTDVEGNASRRLYNLKDSARERQQSLELATQGIDPTRFNRRAQGVNISDRTDPLTFPDSARSTVASSQQIATGIDKLVFVGEQTLVQNREMLTELQTLASRSPIIPQTPKYEPESVLRHHGL
jgi:hypothetical protein